MNLLSHHFLIPTEQMSDPRFFDALIYMCRHNEEGAWGFVVNKPNKLISVGALLREMDIDGGAESMKTPTLNGGVLRTDAGFILHTGLPKYSSSFAISENICLTTSKDILLDLAPVCQFTHYLVLMGFCNWGKNQLEQEINQGNWLVAPAFVDVLFHPKHDQKLPLAYDKLGINRHFFAPTIGSA